MKFDFFAEGLPNEAAENKSDLGLFPPIIPHVFADNSPPIYQVVVAPSCKPPVVLVVSHSSNCGYDTYIYINVCVLGV